MLIHSLFLPSPTQLTVIQGDISELTVDAVVHPTNSSFSLSGQCGRWHYVRDRGGGGMEGEREAIFLL